MSKYKYNSSGFGKRSRSKRSTFFVILLAFVTIGIVLAIALDIRGQSAKKQEVISKLINSSVQGVSVNNFKTEYFQFQTDSTWSAVASESTKTHFVYRSFKGPLVQHDLSIDVNDFKEEVLQNIRTNRVLPVEVDSTGKLNIISSAGEHCKTALPKGAPTLPFSVVQKQVSFVCNPDSVLYEVRIGVVNGTTRMQLPRPDGTKALYSITYRNLKYSPDDVMLQNVIETFQTR
ncbi:hypothetical protein EB118_01495 [bacterium]|nr:hypothetical protein [bacterium]NBX98548.1 hypothetical protein [bacterium]NDC93818.1 hypothetical protein [bacterium]NDD83608.1 hypothetical protein [bacterium]NDG28764.1 hypothetical protein [bacterium]